MYGQQRTNMKIKLFLGDDALRLTEQTSYRNPVILYYLLHYITNNFLSASRLPLVFMVMNVVFNNPSPRRKHYLIETEDENSKDEVSKTKKQP